MKKRIVLMILISYIFIGFALSWNSIPNQEGYFEASWNLAHIDFKKTLLSPGITPLNYLTVAAIEKYLHISLFNAWKLMDLFFGGLMITFLTHIFWQYQKPDSFIKRLIPICVSFSSLGLLYLSTSMTGEGPAIFFALIATYYWWKNKLSYATLFFLVSFFSKYTVYLIAPGIIFWTLINFRKYSAIERKQILLFGVLFMSIFLLYQYLKNWGDIKLQSSYSSSFLTVEKVTSNLPPFIISLLLGAPLVVLFFINYPSISNIFTLAGISSLLILTRHYFYWHYPLQIIPFLTLYAFTHQKAKEFFKLRALTLQFILSLSVITLLPVTFGNQTIFPKHITFAETKIVEDKIKEKYSGGKIGYYMNRPFNEPFPSYEISYMEKNWDFQIEDTEYIVVPGLGLPRQLTKYDQCKYFFVSQVGMNSLFEVNCIKK